MDGDCLTHPDSGVVLLHLYGEVARRWKHLGISTRRVAWVANGAVPDSGAIVQDVEVVTVHMERVRGWCFVCKVEDHGSVVFEVVNVPLRIVWIAYVALCSHE